MWQSNTGHAPHDRAPLRAEHAVITGFTHTPSHRREALAPSDERRLVRAAQAGDEAARRELLEAFAPSVGAIARRYHGSGALSHAELMQEGAVGLLRALERYDPRRGTPFWGYASWWVRQAMQSLVAELTRPVVLSDRALRQLARVKNAQRRHMQTHRHTPSANELAHATGLVPEQVERLQAVDRCPRSLTEVLGAEGDSPTTLLDRLADPMGDAAEQHVERGEAISTARALDGTLTERERGVLRARCGFAGPPQTLREIGDRLGLSAERVRQIESGALDKLRATVECRP